MRDFVQYELGRIAEAYDGMNASRNTFCFAYNKPMTAKEISAAESEFENVADFKDAAWVTPNGKILSMGDRGYGTKSYGSPEDGHCFMSHAEICTAFGGRHFTEEEISSADGDECFTDAALAAGCLRVWGLQGFLEIGSMPNENIVDAIYDYFDACKDEGLDRVTVDMAFPDESRWRQRSSSYNVNGARAAVNDIKSFFSGDAAGSLHESVSDIDAEYLDMLRRGDSEAAYDLEVETAVSRGYDKFAFHGTNASFSTFERGDIGFHFGSREQAEKRLRKTGGGRLLYVALKYSKPLKFDDDFVGWHGDDLAQRFKSEVSRTGRSDSAEKLHLPVEAVLREYDMLCGEYDRGGIDWSELQRSMDAFVRRLITGAGYDAIEYFNRYEGRSSGASGSQSVMVFDPRQIKLLFPLSDRYPLSERFDERSGDIFK